LTLKKVYIGSTNPVKLACTKIGFESAFGESSVFEFIGKTVPSDVSDQPMTNEETLTGALNRVKHLQAKYADGDFFVGIEGGIERMGTEMEAFAWVVIESNGTIGKAQTSTFQLPPQIVDLINLGVELGHADDLVFKRKNSKQGNGAVGILTHNVIDRIEYYRHAVILALIPFTNPELYQLENG
jgi:inosine/xanthosine triphosphatase